MPANRLTRTRSTGRVVGEHDKAAKTQQQKYRRAQPPTKRRRLVHGSSTATSDSASSSSASSSEEGETSSSASESSDEHDNEDDEDYNQNTNTEDDDAENRAKQQPRQSPKRGRKSDVASSASRASSSGSSAYSSPRPLSPIEVNAARRKQRRRSSTQKGRTAAAKKLRREANTVNAAPRFAPSPAKLLPSQQRYGGSTVVANRNFQVRPDIPFASNAAPSLPHQSPRRTTARGTIQAGFRKIAGRMMQKVNNIGISGNAKQGVPALVTGSASSSSLNGKRKRSDHSSSTTSHVTQSTQFGRLDQAAVAGLQPLRRTRSVARKIEKLGVPVSEASGQAGDASTTEDEQSARHDDSDEESIERSIAEMSLDEIEEQNEEEAADSEDRESTVENSDDAYYLHEASLAQLHRLRKDKLVHLTSLLQLEQDHENEDYTKDVLVKLILENRLEHNSDDDGGEGRQPIASSSSADGEDEDESDDAEDTTIHTVTSRRSSSIRHTRRSSAASIPATTNVAPLSGSPRTRRQQNRSSKTVQQSDAASSSDEEEEEVTRQQPRKRSSGGGRSASFGIGLGRPSEGGLEGGLGERTPGRLRSGKLRNSISSMPSSDIEEEAESSQQTSSTIFDGDDNEDDMPTPVARRTRHRRNLSMASASSAGMDDEVEGNDGDLLNHEYRMRKVSLPRKAKGKRASIVELSEEEKSEDEEEEGEQEEEEEAEVSRELEEDQGEDDAEESDEEDQLDDTVDFDLSLATQSSLLRLKRDDLVQLCQDRKLPTEGTKKDLASQLLEWHQQRQETEDEVSSATSETENDEGDEDEDEGDESFQPEGDMSIVSNESIDSVDSSSSSDSAGTARMSIRRARNETKTQALKKLSNKDQSYDAGTQAKPILLQSGDQLVHSKKVDTPPGSGDKQENDLELDLESLNLLDKEIAPDKLKRGEKIGSGGFKDVYEGRYRNVKVALADIRGHLTENDIKELSLLRDLRHANVVRFIGVSIPEQKDVPVTIVTELCANGDLFDYIRNTAPPPLEKILSIMLDIAKGLDYLHKRKPVTIHRDMKSSNVLITARGVAKIADFGLARVRNSTRSIIKSLVGTVNWQAPELWVPHPRYNEKVDVYSAALVFWECLQWHLSQKRYPFEGMNEHAIYQEVGGKQFRPSTATMRRQWGGDILDLVDRMWAQDPKQRPHMHEVVEDLEVQIRAEKARVRAAR